MKHNKPPLERFAQQALEALSPLGPILHRVFEPSIETARAYFVERRRDPYFFAHMIRYEATTRLLDWQLPDFIAFHPLRNSGIEFVCNNCTARVWKSDGEGELQGPGNSAARLQYFDQPFIDLLNPDPTQMRYAILWDQDAETGIFHLSLACPKKANEQRPWDNPECHFYIEFPHAATSVTATTQITHPEPIEDLELQPKQRVSEQHDD